MSFRRGIPDSSSSSSWSMRPPMTTVCPLRTTALVSASRVLMTEAPSAASTFCDVRELTSWSIRKVT